MGHTSGDTQLVMSLVLVVVGAGLYLGGLASGHWVEDTADPSNSSVTNSTDWGLWRKCWKRGNTPDTDEGCGGIPPFSESAYFEATRGLLVCASLLYVLTLCTILVADDRDPGLSMSVWVRRYIHVIAAFSAGGVNFVPVLVFAGSYDDDDNFADPSLGYSFWLSVASSLLTLAGGIMRVVFITWPDRPKLPAPQALTKVDIAPEAPRRRRGRARVDDVMGADALPIPITSQVEEDEVNDKVKGRKEEKKGAKSKFRRFLGFFRRRGKRSTAVSDVITEAWDKEGSNLNPPGIATVSSTTASRTTPPSSDVTKTRRDTNAASHGRSRGKKKRVIGRHVQIVEPFVGYNIPPSPAPFVHPPTSSSAASSSEDEGQGQGGRKVTVKSYQKAVGEEDLLARVVRTPPPVSLPPSPDHEDNNSGPLNRLKGLVDRSRKIVS